jgi:hypothetical protein
MSNQNSKPVHRIRYGAVSIAIWENQSANGTFHNATFERTYRDADENPQSAHSFGLNDLALLQLATSEAARWINDRRTAQAEAAAA